MNSLGPFLQDILAQGSGYGGWGMHHGPTGWGFGMPWFGMIFMMLFWIAVIIAIIFLIRWLILSTRSKSPGLAEGNPALEILKTRYAKGEINKEEFEEKKRDLLA